MKQLENHWVCVGPHGYAQYQTISFTRTGSIKKHIDGGAWNWRKWRRKG